MIVCNIYIFFCSVRQLHREFLRAGADVIQAFTFSMDDNVIDEKVFHIIIARELTCTVLRSPWQRGMHALGGGTPI